MMILVEHCISYLHPIKTDMSAFTAFFSMPEEQWKGISQEYKLSVYNKLICAAETALISGATEIVRKRIELLNGCPIPEWFADCPDYAGLPTR